MRLILHIGAEKTGTTAIQRFLESRENQERYRLSVPSRQGTGNHSYFAAYALESSSRDVSMTMRNLQDDPDKHAAFRELIASALEADIADAKHDTFVISSEDLQRLFNASEIERLRTLLMKHFADVTILMFVRRQDELALSRHGMFVRNGMGERFSFRAIEKTTRRQFYDYKSLFDRWKTEFDSAQIKMVPYGESSVNAGRDSIELFLEAIGREDIPSKWQRANVSLSPARYRFFQMMCNSLKKKVAYKSAKPVLEALPCDALDPILPAARQQAREFLADFTRSNAWIGSEIGIDQVFGDDFSMYPEAFTWDQFDKDILLSVACAVFGHQLSQDPNELSTIFGNPADWCLP